MQLARSRIFADPARLVRDRRALVDQHALRLVRLGRAAVARAGERLAAGAGRLEAASPVQLLARGWSLTWRDDDRGRGLASVAGIEPGARLVTQLADGRLWSRVEHSEFEPDLAHASRQDHTP
jgi:exodeoxyribonuclease VII large subunit